MGLDWLTSNRHDQNVSLTLLVLVFFTGSRRPYFFKYRPKKMKLKTVIPYSHCTQKLKLLIPRKLHFIDTPVKQIQHAIYLFAWIAEGVTQRSHSDVIRNDEQLTRTHVLLAWNADRDGSKAGQRNADRCHIRYYVGHPRNHSVPIDARRVGDPLL